MFSLIDSLTTPGSNFLTQTSTSVMLLLVLSGMVDGWEGDAGFNLEHTEFETSGSCYVVKVRSVHTLRFGAQKRGLRLRRTFQSLW